MATKPEGTSLSRIVYRKDERGVILDSAVVLDDDETPEGFEDAAEYESLKFTSQEAAPVDESKLTPTEDRVDLRQTIDVIKGDTQEGPSDPGGLGDNDVEDVLDDEAGDSAGDGPPPQGGAGSGRDAWAQYAASKNVEVSESDNRDDIVEAVKRAGHPV
jgi:hypothetical protein